MRKSWSGGAGSAPDHYQDGDITFLLQRTEDSDHTAGQKQAGRQQAGNGRPASKQPQGKHGADGALSD